MGDLQQLGVSLLEPLQQIWNSFVQTLPGLLAAVIVILVGFIIAVIVSRAIGRLLERAKADRYLVDKSHLKAVLGDFKFSAFFAQLVKWYIFVWFLPAAADLSNLPALAAFLVQISLWIPNAIVAVLIAFFGLAASEYVSDLLKSSKARGGDVLGGFGKVIILIFTALVVLDQIGIAVSVARNSFLIVLSGVMLALALAVGIGFGLGLKDEARTLLRDLKRKL